MNYFNAHMEIYMHFPLEQKLPFKFFSVKLVWQTCLMSIGDLKQASRGKVTITHASLDFYDRMIKFCRTWHKHIIIKPLLEHFLTDHGCWGPWWLLFSGTVCSYLTFSHWIIHTKSPNYFPSFEQPSSVNNQWHWFRNCTIRCFWCLKHIFPLTCHRCRTISSIKAAAVITSWPSDLGSRKLIIGPMF